MSDMTIQIYNQNGYIVETHSIPDKKEELYIAEKLGIHSKVSFTKCQTSKLESKNYKHATPYVIPSPATTGISGVHSNFILPFGSWLFKKKKDNCTAPNKRAVTTFISTKIN
jgi:hypothetical protein